MWKITKLKLKNFIHIYSGMGKTEINLDLTDDKKNINILIGKMGSGKSATLGHLQPFATYGTLDIRNQDDLIIPEEDGLKEITFINNGHVYDIQHKYSWNKALRNHSTKSFIQLDGKELNENGNVKSFKEIIKSEFGIDQNYLRLLRLGPNVANIINMKSTERKGFVASLLENSEIYTTLHAKLSEDYRNMNSALSVLSNKLLSLSSDKENDLKNEVMTLEDDLDFLLKSIDNIKANISRMQGIVDTITKGKNLIELQTLSSNLKNDNNNSILKLDELTTILEKLPKSSLQKVSIQYGETIAKINSTEEMLLSLQTKISENNTERIKIRDFLSIQQNNQYASELKLKFSEVEEKYNRSKRTLTGFKCSYGYTYLTNFTDTLNSFQLALEEICLNDSKVISKIYGSDNSLKPWASKQIEIAKAKQFQLQKLLTNLSFSAEYSSPIPLYYPPMCPTHDCPFVSSHPVTMIMMNGSNISSEITDLRDKIAQLDKDISIYEDYITQYPKMELLKKNWAQINRVLDSIGALKEKSLGKLLLDLYSRCNWYDYQELIDITEKVKAQEDFENLQRMYFEMKTELENLNGNDFENKEEYLKSLEKNYEELLVKLRDQNDQLKILSENKLELEETISHINNSDKIKQEIAQLGIIISNNNDQLVKYDNIISDVSNNLTKIKLLTSELEGETARYNSLSSRFNILRLQIQDIESTKSSYQEYLEERNTLKMILDSVSAKDGIPLILVKVFLDECKEIVNDLISDIFEDDLEILDFVISEDTNEFKIPFSSNGIHVDDIESASQGQQAVISIALSFALCRKSTFDYNILLLDEIDNSIHKSNREQFISILLKQMRALGTEQIFLITHNDIFQQSGLPVNIIMTTPENIDRYPNQSVIYL